MVGGLYPVGEYDRSRSYMVGEIMVMEDKIFYFAIGMFCGVALKELSIWIMTKL